MDVKFTIWAITNGFSLTNNQYFEVAIQYCSIHFFPHIVFVENELVAAEDDRAHIHYTTVTYINGHLLMCHINDLCIPPYTMNDPPCTHTSRHDHAVISFVFFSPPLKRTPIHSHFALHPHL